MAVSHKKRARDAPTNGAQKGQRANGGSGGTVGFDGLSFKESPPNIQRRRAESADLGRLHRREQGPIMDEAVALRPDQGRTACNDKKEREIEVVDGLDAARSDPVFAGSAR